MMAMASIRGKWPTNAQMRAISYIEKSLGLVFTGTTSAHAHRFIADNMHKSKEAVAVFKQTVMKNPAEQAWKQNRTATKGMPKPFVGVGFK
jgi:hypothetical protein